MWLVEQTTVSSRRKEWDKLAYHSDLYMTNFVLNILFNLVALL